MSRSHSGHSPRDLSSSNSCLSQLVAPLADQFRQLPQRNEHSDRTHHPHSIWEERLAPFNHCELEEIKGTNFRTTRASASTLNQSMARAFELEDGIARICAWVRCKLLKLPVADYARALGISENSVRKMESTRHPKNSRPTADLYKAVLQGWVALASVKDGRTTHLIDQARTELLQHLPGVSSRSSFGVLAGWRYLVGQYAFEEALGCSYKSLWARHKQQQPFAFSELLTAGQKLGMIMETSSRRELQETSEFMKLEKAWISDCVRLGRAKSAAQVHVLMAVAGISLRGETLHQLPDIKLSLRHSAQIARFEPVPLKHLAPVLSYLSKRSVIGDDFNREALSGQIKRDRLKFNQSYEVTLRRIATEQGIDNRKMADAFGLRTPERLKAALPVFRALRYGEYDRATPPGVFALLLARSIAEANSLLAQKRAEISEQLQRRQSSIVSPIYIERALWKVDYAELPFEKHELQSLEWRGESSSLDAQEVITAVYHKGLEKARLVLHRWRRINDHSRVSSAISSLLYHIPHNTLESRLASSSIRLKDIASGREVPVLPTLKRFLEKSKVDFSPRLERDWFNRFAQHQFADGQSDLDRLLTTYIASRAETLGEFHDQRKLRKQACARILSAISVSGSCTDEDFYTLTDRFEIESSSLFYKLFRAVHQTGSIAAAIPVLIEQLTSTQDLQTLKGIRVLRSLLKKDSVHERDLELGTIPLEDLIGATPSSPTAGGKTEAFAMDILRALPGLTAREILKLSPTRIAQPDPLLHSLLGAVLDSGISPRELAYFLSCTMPIERQALKLTENALERRTLSTITAPAVLACLRSSTASEIAQTLKEVRESCQREFKRVGLKPRSLQVEMRIWGIRLEDLSKEKRSVWRPLWSLKAQHPAARALMKEITELGLSKAILAIDRLAFSRQATFTPDVCAMLMARHPAGAMAAASIAHLPLGAGPRFAEGIDIPLKPQFVRMAELSDFPLLAQHYLGWHFSIAELVAARIHNPLNRFLTHLALDMPLSAPSRGAKSNFIQRAHLSLLEHTKLYHPTNYALLKHPERNLAAHWILAQDIMRALGHHETSPLYDFALSLYLYEDTRKALVHWGEGPQVEGPPFPDIKPLTQLCARLVGSIHPLSAAGELLRVEDLLLRKNAALNPSESDEKIQQALSLAQIFYGARISDLVSVPKHSEFRQKFPCLSQQADTISPMPRPIAIGSKVDPLHTQIKQAHAEALTRRRQQIQMRAQIENEIKATHVSQERERHITSLVAKIQQTIRGSASDIPTRTQVQDWCSILGEPTLAAQYSSLYLTAIEAPKGGKTPVEAFVRKFLELLEKRAAREKNGQHNGSDNPRFHVKLDFSM